MYESNDKMVSHPSHYISNGIEVIDVIKAFTDGLSGIDASDTANIIKYACRWKNKGGIQDVEKIIWYATHLRDHLREDRSGEDGMNDASLWLFDKDEDTEEKDEPEQLSFTINIDGVTLGFLNEEEQ